MSEIYNFGAGPACLPETVLQQIRRDIPDWFEGMSVFEVSHRLPVIAELKAQMDADLRKLLSIPDDFSILLMHGGARTQFSLIPLNLLSRQEKADYLITGHWSQLAREDAKSFCQARCVASSEQNQYLDIPSQNEWRCDENSKYLYFADNETIHGTEFPMYPQRKDTLLVSDITSNILTKPLDFSQVGLVFASTQKNLGTAGLTVVILREQWISPPKQDLPYPLRYDVCARSESMANTPAIFCWYVMSLILKWALEQGGIHALKEASMQKANVFYQTLDDSALFYNAVQKSVRSRVTIPFQIVEPKLESLFLQEASKQGFKQLKGHKVVGGLRACFYNAMPLEGVNALIDFMKYFEKTKG